MSKYSQYGIFSEQLKALGFGFVTDFNFDAQEAKSDLDIFGSKPDYDS